MIAILESGLGNVLAFANVYKRLNVPAVIATKAADLERATKIILLGVGAFDHAMEQLEASGMRQKLEELVLQQGVPVLGVCVGMQILAQASEEGTLSGLGWIDGRVKRFDPSALPHATHLPHMGWNDVQPVKEHGLFSGLELDARFYFLHSFYFECRSTENVLAVSDYGGQFACAVNAGNIFGVQFHPEKSHHYGIQLLTNFAAL